MKRTGPMKEKTRQLIALLEKAARKERKAIWLDIAKMLCKPRRQRAALNMWKIEILAKLFKDKHLLVPGKVLGKGLLQHKASVIAFEFSAGARKKIEQAGGTALSIEEALGKKIKGNAVVIVK